MQCILRPGFSSSLIKPHRAQGIVDHANGLPSKSTHHRHIGGAKRPQGAVVLMGVQRCKLGTCTPISLASASTGGLD